MSPASDRKVYPVALGQELLFTQEETEVNRQWHCQSCGGTNLVQPVAGTPRRAADPVDWGTAKGCNQCGKANVLITREPTPRQA